MKGVNRASGFAALSHTHKGAREGRGKEDESALHQNVGSGAQVATEGPPVSVRQRAAGAGLHASGLDAGCRAQGHNAGVDGDDGRVRGGQRGRGRGGRGAAHAR